MNDPFWFDDFSILWHRERSTEFFPTRDQTTEERLNSFMRLTIYIAVLLCFYHKTPRYSVLVLGMGLLTYFVHEHRDLKQVPRVETLEASEKQSVECTKPTLDNPFMNVTMKDYMNIKDGQIVDRPPACDTSEPEIKKQMDDSFNNNLFRDVTDVFGKMNSQRQFFTMPSTTIPNRQDEFAKWLYLNPKTCKEDQQYCLRYEDIRAKRPVFVDDTKNPVSKK
jgi:hypothetical protein